MKLNRIRYVLIPLFLFFGIFVFGSLSVYAAPTAPDSVDITTKYNGAAVTQAAKGSKISLTAQAHGGSGGDGRKYEYNFTYKSPSGGSFASISKYSSNSSVDFTLSEAGTYIFRINARVTDNSGSSQIVTKDVNFKSVGITNKSTISSSDVSLGESVTINASADGGTNYEYYYSVSKDGGSNYAPIPPSSTSAQYTASASCTYKPSSEGNYMLRVIAREKSTGSTDQKVFSVTATAEAIVNKCDVSSNNIEITSKGTAVTLTFGAEKGKAPYKYRCSYTIVNSSDPEEYVYGDSSNFTSGKTSVAYVLKKIGTYKFKFEVQDSNSPPKTSVVVKTVNVTTNLNNTSNVNPTSVNNLSGVNFFCSATGGTGEYEYKILYRIGDSGKEVLYSNYTTNTLEEMHIPQLIERENLDDNFTGKVIFKICVRDQTTGVVRDKEFSVTVTEALAGAISRQQLLDLVRSARDWELTLKQSQRDNLNSKQPQYIASREAAYNAALSDIVQDYGKYYFDFYDKWMSVKELPLGDEFWMTTEVNNAVNFETSLIKGVSDWFSTFSGVNVSTSTFTFNMEDFVNQFSQIFVIFASSLLVILFGVNIIKTALEYQLFTLKGAVSIFGRLILAEIWIQLSTKICVMVVKIFNELMSSILAAVDTSGLLKTLSMRFESSRSGVWLIGDIVDFFANLCPFLLVMLLICVVLVVFVIVYIKLIIRSFEIAMLSVISPVFFACSVGEATMPYFKKFITSFLAVGAEIVFMALVYIAFLWYCKEATANGVIKLEDLYNLTSPVAGKFYTYIAVSVACGVMMIRPPQVLKDLMR